MAPSEPTPPASANERYKALFATAVEFIHSLDQDPNQKLRMDIDRVRAVRTPNFEHSFGHNNFVASKPPLQKPKSVDGFVEHLKTMAPKLESWDTDITDVVVDENRSVCTVRASYYMKPLGADHAVENDLVWWLWMEEGGKKVEKAVEFIDPTAMAKIMEIMMAAKS